MKFCLVVVLCTILLAQVKFWIFIKHFRSLSVFYVIVCSYSSLKLKNAEVRVADVEVSVADVEDMEAVRVIVDVEVLNIITDIDIIIIVEQQQSLQLHYPEPQPL